MDYKYINTEYLESVAAGDTEIIREIVEMFRDQVAEVYDEMKSLYAAKDYHQLGLLAHKVKSSVSIMGMNDLAAMLKTFEIQAKDGTRAENFMSYIERFRSETETAVKELDDLVKNRFK